MGERNHFMLRKKLFYGRLEKKKKADNEAGKWVV